MQKKVIEFYPSGYFGDQESFISFAETRAALESGKEMIRTESMTHLSFGLIDMGYTIILVGRKGTRTKMFPGMTAPNGRTVRHGHNIAKLLLNGVFDPWL